MRYGFCLGLALATLLVACSAEVQPEAARDEESASAPKVVASEAACRYVDFDVFLEAFSASTETQKSSTNFPLQIQSLDHEAEPEPALVSTGVTAAQLELPVFPSRARQLEEGLEIRQSTVGDENKVTIFKADTDYQKSYFFRKDPCWKLVRIRDDSL